MRNLKWLVIRKHWVMNRWKDILGVIIKKEDIVSLRHITASDNVHFTMAVTKIWLLRSTTW